MANCEPITVVMFAVTILKLVKSAGVEPRSSPFTEGYHLLCCAYSNQNTFFDLAMLTVTLRLHKTLVRLVGFEPTTQIS